MIHTLTYKVKGESKIYETTCSLNSIVDMISQIQRGYCSIDGKVVLASMEDFEIFKVEEQNYQYKRDDGKYETINIDEDGDPDPIIITNPYKKDITNKILKERVVSSKKAGDIHLQKLTMTVCGEYFTLKPKSKGRQMFELLLSLKIKKGKNIFTFDDIQEELDNSPQKKLIQKKINYGNVRDILKDKLKEFKEELGIDIIKLTNQGVEILV